MPAPGGRRIGAAGIHPYAVDFKKLTHVKYAVPCRVARWRDRGRTVEGDPRGGLDAVAAIASNNDLGVERQARQLSVKRWAGGLLLGGPILISG